MPLKNVSQRQALVSELVCGPRHTEPLSYQSKASWYVTLMACANLWICWAWWYLQILSICISAQIITGMRIYGTITHQKMCLADAWNLRTDKEWKKVPKLKMSCRCCYLLKYENRSTRVHFVEVIQNNWRNIWTRLENDCSLIICSYIKTCQHYSLLEQVIENNLCPWLLSLRYGHSDHTVVR